MFECSFEVFNDVQTCRAVLETLNIKGIVVAKLTLQLFAPRYFVNAGTLTHISDAELDFFDSGASHLSQTVAQAECVKNPYAYRNSAH